LANTIAKVSGKGWGTTELVREAYGIYGDLGALLPRAHLRRLMRMRNITVSNRGTTVAENGRLLATLVTEGLSNKRLAVILNTSEKGVEGQLSRLFKNTGYRSRVELATALLTGEFDAR
jgi:DNA-binding NarL/FixJ family response regulator